MIKIKGRPCRTNDCENTSYGVYCEQCKRMNKKTKKEKPAIDLEELKEKTKPVRKVVDQKALDKEKLEKKKAREKEKRRLKSERVTDFKLDMVFAKVVKKYYPLFCHACLKPLVLGERMTQACHFVERGRKIVRWDIKNVITGCGSCNGFDSSHVYELGKWINKYYGEGTAEQLRELKVQTYKWSQYQMKELFNLFNDY